MPLVDGIVALKDEMTAWRRHLHAHPETAFEETETAAFVAERLQSFGLKPHRGLAGTGVVAELSTGNGPAIGLRADLDALHITEETEVPHASTVPGKMHACGHDGHTAMLLGAARHLSANPDFRGTVRFIFQPAEENEGGGRRMVEEGLFEQFPVDAVYGLHNWPRLPVGRFAIRAGPMMAAYDRFTMAIRGAGAHAAMPHQGVDPVVAAAQVVTTLQTVVSRFTDPLDSAVLSVTQIHGGDTFNVIPGEVRLGGTARWFAPEVRDALEPALRRAAEGACAAHGATVELDYRRGYPPLVNHAAETEVAARAADAVVGADAVDREAVPSMGAEDFAFMLQAVPGAYIWMGTGRADDDPTLHNPRFDFNDEALAVGASYWVRLVETTLGASASR